MPLMFQPTKSIYCVAENQDAGFFETGVHKLNFILPIFYPFFVNTLSKVHPPSHRIQFNASIHFSSPVPRTARLIQDVTHASGGSARRIWSLQESKQTLAVVSMQHNHLRVYSSRRRTDNAQPRLSPTDVGRPA
jgi:hypothetical protein